MGGGVNFSAAFAFVARVDFLSCSRLRLLLLLLLLLPFRLLLPSRNDEWNGSWAGDTTATTRDGVQWVVRVRWVGHAKWAVHARWGERGAPQPGRQCAWSSGSAVGRGSPSPVTSHVWPSPTTPPAAAAAPVPLQWVRPGCRQRWQ